MRCRSAQIMAASLARRASSSALPRYSSTTPARWHGGRGLSCGARGMHACKGGLRFWTRGVCLTSQHARHPTTSDLPTQEAAQMTWAPCVLHTSQQRNDGRMQRPSHHPFAVAGTLSSRPATSTSAAHACTAAALLISHSRAPISALVRCCCAPVARSLMRRRSSTLQMQASLLRKLYILMSRQASEGHTVLSCPPLPNAKPAAPAHPGL